MLEALLAVAIAFAAAPQDAAVAEAPVAREWWAREVALDVLGRRPDWLAAAASEDWTVRWGALEALLRAARAGLLADAAARDDGYGLAGAVADARELARRALADPHPNLAALGAALLVELGAAGDATDEQLRRLATAPLAEARIAAADLLGARSDVGSDVLLADLVRDADAEVRAAAGRALLARLARGDGAAAPFADHVAAAWRLGGDGEAVVWLAPLVDTGEHALGAVVQTLQDGASSADDRRRVLSLARVAHAAAGAPLAPAELVDAWCQTSAWVPVRDDLFTRAAQRLGPSATRELVRAADLAAAVFEGADTGPDTPRGGAREAALARLRDGPGDAADYPLPSVFLRAAFAAGGTRLFVPEVLRCGDGAFLRALDALGNELAGWTPELADAVFERAEECGAGERVIEAWVLAARSGDAGAVAALARRLGATSDPKEARALFKSLARLPDPTVALAPLAAHWLALADDEALAFVPLLPRVPQADDVRARLLALGQRTRDERGTIAHVLSAWRGDEEVGWYLERWCIEYLAELDGLDAVERRRAADRAAELLPALGVVAGAQGVEGLVQVLDWSIGREPTIGRIAVQVLADTPAGRAALWPFVLEHVDRELRFEIGVALCDPRAAADEWRGRESELVALIAGAGAPRGIDEGARRVAALARLDHADAHAALLELARGERGDEVLGALALEALGRTSVAPAELERVARAERRFDLRRAALRALAERGGAANTSAFARDWLTLVRAAPNVENGWADADWPRRELGIDLALPGHPDELPLLADELRTALVRLDAAAPTWRAELFQQAASEAASDLEARFARRSLPAIEFRFAEELEVFQFEVARGRAAALADAIAERPRLDGRLLLELAGRAAVDDDALALVLVREAVVALLGEGGSATGELLRARALAERLAFAAESWRESAAHALALADPFAARPLGRGDSAARPVPGADTDARREYRLRAHWALALDAAERGDRARARAELDGAASLVFAAGDGSARSAERQREVERRAVALLEAAH